MNESAPPSEQEIAVARVYAQATLSLAESQGIADSVLEELGALRAEIDREPAFESFMKSPLVATEERRSALDRIFRGRLSDVLLDTLQVMNNKGRSNLLRALVEAYRLEHEELRGQIRVNVKTAVPLVDDLRRQLQQVVSTFTGKQAKLEEKVEKSLIGGMVLHIADRRIDTSVAKQIRDLGRRMRDRMSHEIHSGKSYIEEST